MPVNQLQPYQISDYQLNLIGTGLKSPDSFSRASGKVRYNSGLDRINQSICHILGTRLGERFFVPEFGCRIYELIFEPNDYILHDMLIIYIKEALTRWERRIKVLEVNPVVVEGENEVPINITYNLINTNSVYNFVYPFTREIYEFGTYSDNSDIL